MKNNELTLLETRNKFTGLPVRCTQTGLIDYIKKPLATRKPSTRWNGLLRK